MTFEELEKQWGGGKIVEYLHNRQEYLVEFYGKKKLEVEQKNKEARTNGVSYKERQVYSRQIKALDELLKETKGKQYMYGRMVKSKILPDTVWWLNEDDIGMVNKYGVELTLNIYNSLDYWYQKPQLS